jgi:glycogen debranching enzyme
LLALARYAERACGRVPHEVTTNGRVFNPGNIQETPQFTIAVWDYLRWTGDVELARRLFPLCREGVTAYVPTIGGPDPRYPVGDGMVERFGMGSRKLDSACYLIAGLRALANLAAVLGEPDAAAYAARAASVNRDFEQDWWLEAAGLYADSMHSDGSLQLDGHWTAVLPVQLGLASPARAARVMASLEAEFVNQWGLVHTRTREESVWTLPTGLLALAAFQQGRAERGLELARNIALTARHGTLGTFKELIPEGLCFVQLWSAGLYIQAIVEGMLGIQPDATDHAVTLAPVMPADHPPVTLRDLRIGGHHLHLTITSRALSLDHVAGPQALTVRYAGTAYTVAPASTLELNT